MSTDTDGNTSPTPDATDASSRGASSGPLGIIFPPDASVWNESRRMVGDKNIRVEDFATCASQDPVIVLDLLKVSNAMFFSGGKSPITSTKTAIVRLGSDTVVDILEKMKDRPRIENEQVAHWFEIHRSRCRRTAIIARVLGEALARTLSDDCQSAGLLYFTGDLLAVAHFGEKYVALAEEHSRTGLNFRLAQDHKFDVEKVGLSYLRRYGIPEALLFALDREARSRSQDRAIMKPLIMAAGEIIDAFDSNRWEKLAPGKTLAPKSSLRMLQIPDNQYLKIYERCSEYLFSARLIEEKRKQQANGQIGNYDAPATLEPITAIPEEVDSLQSDIQNLLAGIDVAQSQPAPQEPAPIPPSAVHTTKAPSAAKNPEEDQFDLSSARSKMPRAARVAAESAKPAPKSTLVTENGQKIIASLNGLMSVAKTGEELLSNILQMLVESGSFEKTALIVVSKDRTKAKVVAARGPSIQSGQTLIIEDPLSPLAQCFSKVQSFGNRENKNSPWGSRAFAIAPVDADHETPVALYADCGTKGAVSFESRRIFRTVVEILNQKLPQIPGGIPVEI